MYHYCRWCLPLYIPQLCLVKAVRIPIRQISHEIPFFPMENPSWDVHEYPRYVMLYPHFIHYHPLISMENGILSIKKSIKANANIHENGISCYLPLTSPHSHRTTASRSSCDSKVSRCRKPKRRSKIARADWWCQPIELYYCSKMFKVPWWEEDGRSEVNIIVVKNE